MNAPPASSTKRQGHGSLSNRSMISISLFFFQLLPIKKITRRMSQETDTMVFSKVRKK
jgi:hypothetical protein